jgi:hypothetical protein
MDEPAENRWLFGPAPDLAIGCGLLYVAVFGALAIGGEPLRSQRPELLLPLLLFFVSMPHYGATLLRVYEERASRRRYTFFALYASIAVLGCFAAGLYHPFTGALFLTVYLTWSPWHYSGQNYGLAVMFLRRRGLLADEDTKRWLYGSFTLSYVLMFLVFHVDRGGEAAVNYGVSSADAGTVSFVGLGIPPIIATPLFVATVVAYVACLGIAGVRLLRTASARDLAPVAALATTQALWFSIPVLFLYSGVRTGIAPIDQYQGIQDYVFFIAIGHAAQYLWVTSYYARQAHGGENLARYFGKTVLAGITIWTLPLLLFSPDLLGPNHGMSTVATLMAAGINIHHFVLDGAIWKLRDGPIARVLLRADPVAEAGAATASWPRRAAWIGLSTWIALQGYAAYEYKWGALGEVGPLDASRVERAVDRLRWIGRDDPNLRFRLGTAAGESGDLAEARSQFERGLQLEETAQGWVGISYVEFHAGRADEARQALERAVASEPENPEAWVQSAQVWQALGDSEAAERAYARAATLDPNHPGLRARTR